MQIQIDWSNLEKNTSSKELSFESFNFQIAWVKYTHLGDFEYDYNTPGAEFFLTLKKDCPELNLKTGDIVGWQAKFWLNHKDMNNTQMGSKQRKELKDGSEKTLKQKPDLKAWIICTPGQIELGAKKQLEDELHAIKSDLIITFWNKPIYEAFYHESHEKFNPIFAHYFSSQFIGYGFLNNYTQMRINRLRDKFDTDLYVPTNIDLEIESILNYNKIMSGLHSATHEWQDYLRYGANRCQQYISQVEKSQEYNVNLSNLLSYLIGFSNRFHEKYYEYKDADNKNNILGSLHNIFNFVHAEIKTLNSLIEKIQSSKKDDSNKERFVDDNLNREINSQFEIFDKIYDLYKKFYQRDIHVFGKAGHGKTNLACAICRKALEEKIPAILILASEIRAESNISKWITDSLQAQCDLATLLGFINNLGFLKQTKIPFVIDGLNEKYPNASVWQAELDYLRQQVGKYPNVILITTSRESYVKQIFNKTSYKEVHNNYYLEGFDKYDRYVAIKKYFGKYRITINNDDYDKSIFQNPLLLKIFCTVHEGKTFTLYPTNIYETMERYYEFLVNRVAASYPGQESIMPKIINDRITNFCLKLLDNNSKYVDYQKDFFSIFDPDFVPSSQPKVVMSDKVLDEGMFIKREMVDNQEVVEFTHDFIGGFSISKALAFGTSKPQDILKRIQDSDVMSKVIDLNTGEFSHPLSEDILKNLIYFFKRNTGGQLFDVVKLDSVLKLGLSMLEVADLSDKESQDLINKVLSSANKDLIISFFETNISNIADKNDYRNIELLLCLIEKLSARDIDLYWSESIRKHSAKIFKYLDNFTDMIQKSNDKILGISYFLSCLLSSTHRLIRDMATKALVILGGYSFDDLFATYKRMENVSDKYIIERIVAALCGVILRKGSHFKEKCIEIAEYLEDKYFNECSTTHLLILDYVDTILHYVSTFYSYKRIYTFDLHKLRDWQKDEECLKELSGDGKATWGYGPIRMDFAKYTIGHHIASYGYSRDKAPSLKESVAMVIWRMKQLGYDEKVFDEIDKECSKARHSYSPHDNSGSIERYGKKYSWIAFFELYGQFVLKKVVDTEANNSFRVSSIDIDPTFPELPKKEQLITKCFLPRTDEDIQKWVNRSEKPLFQEIYSIKAKDEVWILLNCRHHQQSVDGIRIDINVDAVLLPSEKGKEALDILNNSEENRFDHDIEQYYYLFNGEIPWGKLIPATKISEFFSNPQGLSFYSPYSWFSWESYHSRMNDIGNIPFLAKAICDEFNLKYDIESFAFFDNGEACTKYYHDNFSHYYFLKESHIKKFLEKNNLSLIWCEFGYKYGDFGSKNKRKLEPSTNRFRSAMMMMT